MSGDAAARAASWRALLDRLTAETELAGIVVYKYLNVHRRTRYMRAFRDGVGAVRAGVTALSTRVKASTFAAAEGGSPAATAVLAGAATLLAGLSAELVGHARVVTATQKGAGFANLLAVLAASLAAQVHLVLQARDCVQEALRAAGRAPVMDAPPLRRPLALPYVPADTTGGSDGGSGIKM